MIQTKKRLDRIESQRIEHEKAAAASRFSIFNTLSRNSYETLDGEQGGVEEETRESTLDKEQREKEEKEQLERRLSTAPAALVLPPTNNTT